MKDEIRWPATKAGRESADHDSPVVPGERNLCFFFKIILPPVLEQKTMRIPNKFVSEFGNDLSSMATLVVPTMESWKVSIRSKGGEFWFCAGWDEFVQYYSINYGYFLLFHYHGNSAFRVHIFDLTACEISYPSSKTLDFAQQLPQSHQLEPDNDNDGDSYGSEDDSHCVSDDEVAILERPQMVSDHVNAIELSSDDEDPQDQPCARNSLIRKKDVEIARSCAGDGVLHSGGRKGSSNRGLQGESTGNKSLQSRYSLRASAGSNLKPKNPRFRAIMKYYNLRKSMVMNVPSDIARKYLKGVSGAVKLEVSDGRTWTVQGNFMRGRLSSLGKGWCNFARDNNLEVGDVCVFELLSYGDRDFRMKVSVHHLSQGSTRKRR